MNDLRIGFVGAGQMARALARGFLRAGVVAEASQILAAAPSPAARRAFLEAVPGARWTNANPEVAEQSQVVFLAVKPHQLASATEPFRLSAGSPPVARGGSDPLWVSIVAGASMASLSAMLTCGGRLIRVMPNAPCLVGQGATAYSVGSDVRGEERTLVERLLRSVGQAIEVEERLLDAVTGLSGSGPAYVYQWMEALADGGVLNGLSRSQAMILAVQTIKGAAEMALQTGLHPGQLKDQVASPAGTTMAGLQVLEQRGVRGAIIDAVSAATRRATTMDWRIANPSVLDAEGTTP